MLFRSRKAKFQGKSAAEIVKMNTPPSNELEKKEDAPVIGEGNEGEALKQNIFQKAASFAQAVASKGINNNIAAPTTYSLRVLSCHGDESKGLPPCPKRLVSQKYANSYYCGACGCGDKPFTQLLINGEKYSKLDYPFLKCPLEMPGFSNYSPASPKEVHENSRKARISANARITAKTRNARIAADTRIPTLGIHHLCSSNNN